MKAVRVKPMCQPEIIETDGSLESLKKEVEGWIQVVYPWDDEVVLVHNDEGKLMGLDYNRGLYNADGRMYDYIAGNFVILGEKEGSFCSLSDEQAEKYAEEFRL